MPQVYYTAPTKQVRFEDDEPKRPKYHHHHHHHHGHRNHAHVHDHPSKRVIYYYDDEDPYYWDEKPYHHYYHHDHHHQPPVKQSKRAKTLKFFPPPQCHNCYADFPSEAELELHRLNKPRHCPQHMVCFSEWSKHCFEYDHVKCPRSMCKDLPPFATRQKCLEHMRAWHGSPSSHH